MSDAAGALLAAFDEPLLLLDGTAVREANPAARALFGAAVTGQDARLVLRHPEAAAIIAAVDDGPVAIGGLGDSERRWELSARTLAGGGRLLRLHDRSAAQAAERMRTDFVANASHELRTPLASLIGFIETLQEANGPADATVRTRFLGIMAGEARRMQRLIDDLMSLSRIEVDRFVVPREHVDLAAAVRTACAELSANGRNDGRVHCDVGEREAWVAGDVGQLSQVVHNLVSNALKYGRESGSVRITLDLADAACLSVADEGEGIPAELIPRLTERFYRVDPARSRTLEGTGLGLSIVKHIVERHRGRLEITSVRGEGTTVRVTLPLLA